MQNGPLLSLRPPPRAARSAHLRPGPAPQFRCRHLSCSHLSPRGRARGPLSPLPSAQSPSRQGAHDPPAHRRPRSPLASSERPSPGLGRGGRPQGGSPLRPQPRARIPDGARPCGGAERAHNPDLFPGLPAGAPAVPPRRVTAAAPPPSWARLALPTPAGSGQPRPQRIRAGPCLPSFFKADGEETGTNIPQFFTSVLPGHPKDSRFHFAGQPSCVCGRGGI